MIESFSQPDLFPRIGIVTRLAGILESTVMRVGMTIRALFECDSDIFYIGPRSSDGAMAFCASDICVSSRQAKFRVLMVEFCRRLPASFGVATRTIGAQLPFVFIRMARVAFTREAQKSTIQILNDYRASLACRNVLRVMTLIACEACMCPHKRITCFRVIE